MDCGGNMEEFETKILENRLMLKSMYLAIKLHNGQKYGEHDYEYHLRNVVFNTSRLIFSLDMQEDQESYICTAWLHDTLEDTNITYDELLSEFGKEIADAVQAMTKPKNVPYWTYIVSIGDNKIATLVKLADAVANYTECIKGNDQKRAAKYADVISYLEKPFKQYFGEIKND